MNVATRQRHAKKSPVVVQEEGFKDSSRHRYGARNNRRLLFILVMIAGIIILFTNIVWDIRRSPRFRQPSKSFFQAKALRKARNSQQHQQQLVLQEDFSIRASPPCNLASYYNFLFPEHGCLDNEMAGRVHCRFRNLRIDMTKVHGTRMGGESLASVMGQDESVEYLSYEKGAFVVHEPFVETTTAPLPAQPHKKHWHYMNHVRDALVYKNHNATINTSQKPTIKCDQTWPGLTLFITRYEYVNLYHTMTDWWNTFFTMTANDNGQRIPNNKKNNVNIVFLDAHAEGNLDPVWTSLFGKVSFLRRLPGNHICFEEARFVPAGYTSPLYPRGVRSSCPTEPKHTKQFVNHFLNVYNLSHVHRIPGHVVAIERVPYISHPRSKPNKTERLLSNLRELAMQLPETMAAHTSKHGNDKSLSSFFSTSSTSTTKFPKATVQVVTLVNDTMRDQIAAIRQADVLLANHGAGLTHLLFLDQGAHVIELGCRYDFFVELAKWRRGHDVTEIHHYCQDFINGDQISDQFWKDNVVQVIAGALAST